MNPSLTGIAAVPGFHDVVAGANGLYTAKPGLGLHDRARLVRSRVLTAQLG